MKESKRLKLRLDWELFNSKPEDHWHIKAKFALLIESALSKEGYPDEEIDILYGGSNED